jgi:hypothetical protein
LLYMGIAEWEDNSVHIEMYIGIECVYVDYKLAIL